MYRRIVQLLFQVFLNEGMDIFRITCLFLVCQDINTWADLRATAPMIQTTC